MNSSLIRTNRLVAENGLYLPPPGTGGGGGGITQLTGDVLAGPAVGTTPATVVRINGATVPAAGALTTGAVLRVTGASALAYGPVNLALPAAVTGLLPVANIAPSGTNGFVLTTTGGATVWAAAASGGITQLTGDVTAGPGSGSVAATVARINGATVPAAGALTTGQVLQVSGASALAYGALNLGTPASITGLLPVANIAPGTNTFVLTTTGGVAVWAAPSGGSGITQLTQDVLAGPGSGSQAATVAQITGVTGVANVVSGTNLSFLTGGQTVSTNGRINFPTTTVAANTFIGAHFGAGDIRIISTDGAGTIIFGDTTGVTTATVVGSAGNTINWSNSTANGATINSTKWTFLGTPTFFNSSSNVTIGGTTADFGGGAGLLSFAPATTAPTVAPATNGNIYQNGIGLHYSAPIQTSPGSFQDFMLAPVLQGTPATQALVKNEYQGVVTTTGTALATILTIPVPTGDTVSIEVLVAGRDTAGGTVGDGTTLWTIFQFKNVGGTVTQGATLATPVFAADTSMASGNVSATVSGTNALVQVTGGVASGGKTIDWTAIAKVIQN
jgi:hypothetical protein